MSQQQSQFTPAQIYAAGLHAEQEGRADYARQYYEFLIAHHPDASETSLARQALDRLTSAAIASGGGLGDVLNGATRHGAGGAPAAQGGGFGFQEPRQVPAAFGASHVADHGTGHGPHHAQNHGPARGQGYEAASQRGRGGRAGDGRQLIAHGAARHESWSADGPAQSPGQSLFESDDDGPAFVRRSDRSRDGATARGRPRGGGAAAVNRPVPERAGGYLAGRIISGCLTVLGVLAVLAGFAVLGLSMLGAGAGGALSASPMGGLIGPTAIGAGLTAILIGQLASAILDGANAMRDLARLERHRIEQAGDER